MREMRAVSKTNTKLNWWLTPRWRENWSQDGGAEHNWKQTLPQKTQRGNWEFPLQDQDQEMHKSLDPTQSEHCQLPQIDSRDSPTMSLEWSEMEFGLLKNPPPPPPPPPMDSTSSSSSAPEALWYELCEMLSQSSCNTTTYRYCSADKMPKCFYQCCGSICFGPPGSGSASQNFNHQAKIVRKTLITAVLWLLFDFIYLKNDVSRCIFTK